mgnify:CR=1 FL=1
MVKNILIYGGYNWFGYELIHDLLEENKFCDFIIIDSFQNILWKNNIKDKLDHYKYLFQVNIFLYSNDIKDNHKLEFIYKKHKITHVINNIKYNILDYYSADKIQGYEHIMTLNRKYKISQYICLYRYITHDDFMLNNDGKEHVSICTKFNSCVKKINTPKNNDNMKIFHVNICDYVYGLKKDKYNDILYILNNIAKSSTNFSCHNNEIGLTYDEHLLSHVKDILNYNYANTLHTYLSNMQELYKISKFHLFDKGKTKTKSFDENISNNPLLLLSLKNI